MRFCSLTLGCKVNQYETQGIEGILIAHGHMLAKPGDGCDVCIINTCAVTAESARKSRQAVRRLRKLEPYALVAVCGCLSELDPSMTISLGADLVGGSGNRRGFALEIEEAVARGVNVECRKQDLECRMQNMECRMQDLECRTQNVECTVSSAECKIHNAQLWDVGGKLDDPIDRSVFEELLPGVVAGRTRALLKIQDGCDNYCAYCVIPYARGHARSLPLERVAEHARMLDARGFREIVITGIEISSYGKDLVDHPMLTYAAYIIGQAAPNARLRLGSLEPGVVTEGFCISLGAIANLCNHFHLSLQSGCDGTLRRMGRKYDTNTAFETVSLLRNRFPDCGITADLIVGFPGETDAEFEKTLEFIKDAAFSDMHIFPFSMRPGTRAADMPDQIAKEVKRERARIATLVAEEMAHSFKYGQIGKTVDVLFERKRDGFWCGHSGNYLEVTARDGGAKNDVDKVTITSIEDGTIWGEIT